MPRPVIPAHLGVRHAYEGGVGAARAVAMGDLRRLMVQVRRRGRDSPPGVSGGRFLRGEDRFLRFLSEMVMEVIFMLY
jgi:hypothetical protein